MKRERRTGQERNSSTDSKGAAFVILINHASVLLRKERLSPTSKARSEASRNEVMEKGGMPDRVKSFREISGKVHCPVERIVREPGLGLLNSSEMD